MAKLAPIASPSTRKLAADLGVDLAALAEERDDPEISRAAVLRKSKQGKAGSRTGPASRSTDVRPDPWDVDHARYGPVEGREMSRLARVAAAHLTAAHHTIPAVTHHDRADLTEVEAFRGALADEAAGRGVRLTALAFHVKALVRSLEKFETFNASLSADGATLILKKTVSIGIAVDTPYGLVVPVLRDLTGKGLWRIAVEVADLAARAQARKIRPEETGGAGMSITNLGAIGGRGFTPIVNPPEVAILGLSRASMEPVWNGSDFEPRLIVPLDLTYDHRVINGADAARFVAHYASLITDPRRLLL